MKKLTFTKKLMVAIIAAIFIWITLSYILAFVGREQIAETLSSTVAQFGLGAIIGYLAKSFFETRSEENMKFLREQRGLDNSIMDEDFEIYDESTGGDEEYVD